jgi:hypothetical protein
MTDILDLNPNDVPEYRELPEGDYLGNVIDYTTGVSQQGSDWVQFSFRVSEPLSGQDMSNVQTNLRVFSKRLYLTEKARKITTNDISRFGVPKLDSYRDWFDAITGAPVKFTVTLETNEKTGKKYRTVNKWSAAS